MLNLAIESTDFEEAAGSPWGSNHRICLRAPARGSVLILPEGVSRKASVRSLKQTVISLRVSLALGLYLISKYPKLNPLSVQVIDYSCNDCDQILFRTAPSSTSGLLQAL